MFHVAIHHEQFLQLRIEINIKLFSTTISIWSELISFVKDASSNVRTNSLLQVCHRSLICMKGVYK